MAIRTVNLTKRFDFVWDEDPDVGTEDATVFEYRALSSHEQAFLNDRMMTMEGGMPTGGSEEEVAEKLAATGMRAEAFKTAVQAVRLACTGVTNLQDEDGEVLEYKQVKANINGRTLLVLDDALLAPLPIRLVMAFYRKIMESNLVSKEAAKNSD